MATRAVSTTITYRAWDISANAPKTGDVANHTLRWIKDGTSSATSNSPAEVDATNAKGIYKIVMTSTETDCTFGVLAGVSSTANIAIFGVQIAFDYIPNAVAGAAGGLFIAGTNAATTVTTSFTSTFTGNLTGSVASVTGAVGSVTGSVGSVTGAVGSVTGSVGSVTGLTASNLDATISSRMATYAQPTGFLAATFPSGTVANTTNITAGVITTATNLTNAPTAGDLTATMKTSVENAVWDAVGASHVIAGSTGKELSNASSAGDPWAIALPGTYGGGTAGYIVGTNIDATVSSRMASASYTAPPSANTIATAVLTNTMTESYPTQGASFTLTQGIYDLVQQMGEKSISGTTLTVNRRDQVTPAKTFILNDATNPSAITEAP